MVKQALFDDEEGVSISIKIKTLRKSVQAQTDKGKKVLWCGVGVREHGSVACERYTHHKPAFWGVVVCT
jgi:hypothetical protein